MHGTLDITAESIIPINSIRGYEKYETLWDHEMICNGIMVHITYNSKTIQYSIQYTLLHYL